MVRRTRLHLPPPHRCNRFVLPCCSGSARLSRITSLRHLLFLFASLPPHKQTPFSPPLTSPLTFGRVVSPASPRPFDSFRGFCSLHRVDLFRDRRKAVAGTLVNNSICLELTKLLNNINLILPAIESARPGCSSGIQELCSLNTSIDKAKLLLQHCAESSKLYLAISRETTLSRCERIRSSLIHSLCQIQTMVPPPIASKIAAILEYLRVTKFEVGSSEEEAGRALLDLLHRPDTSEDEEFETFQIAALRHTNSASSTSSSSNYDEPGDQGEAPTNLCQAAIPPEEFLCPISSRLMYDPVVITSGQTYERIYIEKWFSEGHDTCPKTQRKLENFYVVPNSCMKDLITNWSTKHGIKVPEPCSGCSPADFYCWEPSHSYSISSLKNVSAPLLDGSIRHYFLQNDHSNVSFISSDASYCSESPHINSTNNVEDDYAHFFSWSDDYQQCQSFSNFNHEMFLRFFCRLLELPNDVQDKAVENTSMEALTLLHILAQDPRCRSDILSSGVLTTVLKSLDSEVPKYLELSLNILLDLSADKDVKSYMLSSGCITKLASFMMDGRFAYLCLKIIQSISSNEEGAMLVAKATACLASIAELLDTGSKEEQELAVDILYAICSQSFENCLLIMDEGVIPALVNISVNGNAKGKEVSQRLLHHLRDVRHSDRFVNLYINPESEPEPTQHFVGHSANERLHSKSVSFFGRKIRTS
ncbi:hypothetical protein C4D60_Mb01t15490 [Musa balbisiana]|uniref:RING-type E3 ubiquitin transferase n=1 Tax=Musa balbisiana TaxID=52838 RepID=A0A4S8JMF4_MUSBA|nr:hypothetical protein C4D60_Mb01t15490 [Musa balbisiana]